MQFSKNASLVVSVVSIAMQSAMRIIRKKKWFKYVDLVKICDG